MLFQAKIVERLLGFEIEEVSCGSAHVMAVTNDGEVFAWGRGDAGWYFIYFCFISCVQICCIYCKRIYLCVYLFLYVYKMWCSK